MEYLPARRWNSLLMDSISIHLWMVPTRWLALILEDATLERESLTPISGDYPKSIAILPDNKTLVSLNHDSNEIRTFSVNHEHKTVLMKNAPVKIDKPNSIVIHKLS